MYTHETELKDTIVQVVYCRLPTETEWRERLVFAMNEWLQPIREYRQWQDRCRFWMGRKLLAYLLTPTYTHFNLNSIRYTNYGRPYIEHCCDFNISHSGDFVIASVTTNGRIGIDIEQIKDVCIDDFVEILSPDQLNIIKKDEEPTSMFYRIWTMRESVVKLLGSGISTPLQNILSDFSTARIYNSTYYLKELDIDKKYSLYLATDRIVSSLSLKELKFKQVTTLPEMLK